MKTIIHYLNWALHDINHFFWSTLVLNVKYWIYSAVVIAIPLLLFVFLGEIAVLLIILYFPVVFWLTISYLLKKEREVVKQVEVYDQFGLSHIGTTEPDPITWKQALGLGSLWVYYTGVIFIVASILLFFFNEEIQALMEYLF